MAREYVYRGHLDGKAYILYLGHNSSRPFYATSEVVVKEIFVHTAVDNHARAEGV